MARTPAQRKADALAKLERDLDVWVATAGGGGRPHLVPLSLAWDGCRGVVATEAGSATARNAARSPVARLALGGTRDVVLLDVGVESVVPTGALDAATGDAFAARTGWDPRGEDAGGDGWVFLLMRPRRVQVWRDVEEMAGRVVMRDGEWVA